MYMYVYIYIYIYIYLYIYVMYIECSIHVSISLGPALPGGRLPDGQGDAGDVLELEQARRADELRESVLPRPRPAAAGRKVPEHPGPLLGDLEDLRDVRQQPAGVRPEGLLRLLRGLPLAEDRAWWWRAHHAQPPGPALRVPASGAGLSAPAAEHVRQAHPTQPAHDLRAGEALRDAAAVEPRLAAQLPQLEAAAARPLRRDSCLAPGEALPQAGSPRGGRGSAADRPSQLRSMRRCQRWVKEPVGQLAGQVGGQQRSGERLRGGVPCSRVRGRAEARGLRVLAPAAQRCNGLLHHALEGSLHQLMRIHRSIWADRDDLVGHRADHALEYHLCLVGGLQSSSVFDARSLSRVSRVPGSLS